MVILTNHFDRLISRLLRQTVIAHAKQAVDFEIEAFPRDRVRAKDQESTMVAFQNYPRAIPVISGPERMRILAFAMLSLKLRRGCELEIRVLVHETR